MLSRLGQNHLGCGKCACQGGMPMRGPRGGGSGHLPGFQGNGSPTSKENTWVLLRAGSSWPEFLRVQLLAPLRILGPGRWPPMPTHTAPLLTAAALLSNLPSLCLCKTAVRMSYCWLNAGQTRQGGKTPGANPYSHFNPHRIFAASLPNSLSYKKPEKPAELGCSGALKENAGRQLLDASWWCRVTPFCTAK